MVSTKDGKNLFCAYNSNFESHRIIVTLLLQDLIHRLYILVQRNHNTGNLETGIPDDGNRLNSA